LHRYLRNYAIIPKKNLAVKGKTDLRLAFFSNFWYNPVGEGSFHGASEKSMTPPQSSGQPGGEPWGGEASPWRTATPLARHQWWQSLDDSARAALVPELGAALTEADVAVRRAAADLLGEAAVPSAAAAMVAALEDPDLFVRYFAAEGLKVLREPRTSAALCKALRDESWLVRKAAAEALALVGDDTAIGPLIPLLTDPSPFVRRAAALALEAILDRRQAHAASPEPNGDEASEDQSE
jgi:hypothetical protein